MPGGGSKDFRAHGFRIRSRRHVNGQIRWCRVGEIAEKNVAIHQNLAALTRIIVVNIDDAKISTRSAECQRYRVPRGRMMFVGEWFADNHVVGVAKLGQHLGGRASREKIRFPMCPMRGKISS